jgi:hypothetical protein
MTDTISATGSLASNVGNNGATTLAITAAAVGGVVVFVSSISSTTISVSSVSGGGVGGQWTRIAGPGVATSHTRNLELWMGTLTATGAQTITITPSASVATTRVDLAAQQFISAAGASSAWSTDGAGAVQNNAAAAVVTWPTLTPTNSGRAYVGYGLGTATTTTTSPAGYTAVNDSFGNPFIYNTAVPISAQAPTVTQTAGNTSAAVGALIYSGTDPVVDLLRTPVYPIQIP